MAAIAVTGASGLIGTALVDDLRRRGHDVRPLRHGADWAPGKAPAVDQLDAFVHLAGEPIAQRWTPSVKARIMESRAEGTRTIAEAIGECEAPPTLVCSSAVGYYGDRGDEELEVESGPGTGFLAEVCQEWEAAADAATGRVVKLRTGIVLSADGGALAKMLLPFKLGVGGRVGSGKQWWPWVALPDMVGLIERAIFGELDGPVHAVAGACQSEEFTRTLARVLRRPHVAPLPAFAVRGMFGEMGEQVLLASQRVRPGDHEWRLPSLEGALRNALS